MLLSFNQRYYLKYNDKCHYFFHIDNGVCTFLAPAQEHNTQLIPFLEQCDIVFKEQKVHTFRQIPLFLETLSRGYIENQQYHSADMSIKCSFFEEKILAQSFFRPEQLPRMLRTRAHAYSLDYLMLLSQLMHVSNHQEFLLDYGICHFFGNMNNNIMTTNHNFQISSMTQHYQKVHPDLFQKYTQKFDNFFALIGHLELEEIGSAWARYREQDQVLFEQPNLYL